MSKGEELGKISSLQERLHNYHLLGTPRCTVKIDNTKAFDSVSCDFLEHVLQAFYFPSTFIQRVMSCISNPKFFVMLNGKPSGYFSTKRGLRHGDHLSPYLFTMCMEVLSRMIHQAAKDHKCKVIELTHLIFANQEVLDRFHHWSGLKISFEKNEVFFSGVHNDNIEALTSLLGIKVGSFPKRNLGVLLISGRLTYKDCLPLIDTITARIRT